MIRDELGRIYMGIRRCIFLVARSRLDRALPWLSSDWITNMSAR
jgi:hypothetical protein